MGSRSTKAKARRSALVGWLALATVGPLGEGRASAQGEAELRSARELFQEAFRDEQERRYPEALEKFRRVAKVKESASVRYRIATVLAGMGRLREARDAYRTLASRAGLGPSDYETADSAAERAADLNRRIPRLSLRLSETPPAETRVTVDGAPIPVSTTARAFELDPGEHVVAATGRGIVAIEKTLTLPDGGGDVEHTIVLAREALPAATPERPGTTLAWVAVGGGTVLAVTGVALLVAREGAIDDVERTCPANICPVSTRTDVESDRDRASLFGPVGVGFGVLGVAALGIGTYVLVRSFAHRSVSVTTTPAASARLRGFTLSF